MKKGLLILSIVLLCGSCGLQAMEGDCGGKKRNLEEVDNNSDGRKKRRLFHESDVSEDQKKMLVFLEKIGNDEEFLPLAKACFKVTMIIDEISNEDSKLKIRNIISEYSDIRSCLMKSLAKNSKIYLSDLNIAPERYHIYIILDLLLSFYFDEEFAKLWIIDATASSFKNYLKKINDKIWEKSNNYDINVKLFKSIIVETNLKLTKAIDSFQTSEIVNLFRYLINIQNQTSTKNQQEIIDLQNSLTETTKLCNATINQICVGEDYILDLFWDPVILFVIDNIKKIVDQKELEISKNGSVKKIEYVLQVLLFNKIIAEGKKDFEYDLNVVIEGLIKNCKL